MVTGHSSSAPFPATPSNPHWIDRLREAGPLRIGVVGGSGRLGSWLCRFLTEASHAVVVLDLRPPQPLPNLEFVSCDLRSTPDHIVASLRGCDAVVHLAGLHGAHLAAGADRRDFWTVNVRGTEHVLQAACCAEVRRVVLASSTSIYGSGSPPRQPARVLDELTALAPQDAYYLTKLAAERLLRGLDVAGVEGVALRLGRFFFPWQTGYHLRKLSTGLDVLEACQAIALALIAPRLRQPVYCVASDLPLHRDQRERLGIDAEAVLLEVIPSLVDAARDRGVPIPSRVGKSVSSDQLRSQLGYQPERSLAWVAQSWSSQLSLRQANGVVP
jgi:UDP-glucose 4-epimerase